MRDPVPTRDPEFVALAEILLESISEFSDGIAAQIRAKVRFYAEHSVVSGEELHRSSRANAEFVLRSFVEDHVPDVTAASETGRRRAEQGVPLPVVMAAFRVGFSQIWRNLVEQARARGLVSSEALVDVASDVWAAHDTFAEAMAMVGRATAVMMTSRFVGGCGRQKGSPRRRLQPEPGWAVHFLPAVEASGHALAMSMAPATRSTWPNCPRPQWSTAYAAARAV
jgi:hypothetical protein